jgi:hypothetical protein
MRIGFLKEWINSKERPLVFRLGAFFHPDEFLTAVCQVYARKKKVPFDSVCWRNRLLTERPTTVSEDGIFVENLYLEGAKWDPNMKTLVECGQKELITQLPVVEFVPTEMESVKETWFPIYRMQNRGTGALDLPNHVMDIAIPVADPEYWIQRSVAVFITAQR